MKKFFKSLALVAVAAASLFACQKPNLVEPNQTEYTYTFTLGSEDDTKALLDGNVTKWETNDKLGFYAVRGTNSYLTNNAVASVNIDDTPVTFNVKANSALNSGDAVYAYYPYSSINYSSSVKPNAMTISIPASQRGTMSDMPMVSKKYTLESSVNNDGNIPTGDIVMQNLCGVFQFNVYSLDDRYVGEVLKGVRFDASSPIAGVINYNLIAGDLDISELGYSESTIMVEKTVGSISGSKSEAQSIAMVVAPGSYEGTVTVYTDKAEYRFDVSTEKTVERSHIKPLNVDLAKGARTSKAFVDKCEIVFGEETTGWTLELASWNANDYWPLATTSTYITSPVFEDLSKIKSIQVYARTYGTADNNSKKLNIKVGDNLKSTQTLNSTYTEYEYTLAEGDLTGSGAVSFICPGGTNSTDNSAKGIRIQRITIRYLDDSTFPKIYNGEIDQVPARSSDGRFKIQTKNIDSALEVLEYSGIDFDEIDIKNGNELVYTVSDNDSKDVKNGTITVALASDNSVKGTISISQAAARFSAARTSVDLKAAANSQTTVTITSDFDWTIEGVDSKYSVSPTLFTYDPDASEPGKKTITIKALNANTTAITDPLGAFNIVNSKSGLGSIEITVNQLSSKLPAPVIGTVTPKDKDKQVTVQWSKVTNAAKYEYFLIDEDLNIIESTRTQTADNNVLQATIDVPEYGVNYYFGIISKASAGGEWDDSTEAVTEDAFNLTEQEESTGITYEWTFPQSSSTNSGFTDKNNTSGTSLRLYNSSGSANNGSWSNTTKGSYIGISNNGYYVIQVPITSSTTGFNISADIFGWANKKYAAKSINKVSYYTSKKSNEVDITPSGSPSTTTSGCYALSLNDISFNSAYIPTTDAKHYLYIRIYTAAGNVGFESLSVTVE